MLKKIVISFYFLMALIPHAIAGTLNASVDKAEIAHGEPVHLKISYEGDDGNMLQPDLSDLQSDFTIYSTSTSIQSNFINGKSSQRREWNISLLPNRDGKLTIPVIHVGQYKTEPLDITVLSAGASATKSQPKLQKGQLVKSSGFSIKLSVDNERPYVQQEVNAVLTILDERGLVLQQRPEFVNAENWIIKSLKEPTSVDNNGKREIKFYYALFPQKSGKQILPTAHVKGFYMAYDDTDPFQQSMGGIFRIFDVDVRSMFGVQKEVLLETQPEFIDIKPIAADNGDNWWLPAQTFGLTANWVDSRPKFKVGETVAREFVMTAVGVAETQLPDIEFSENAKIKQYPEKPQVTSVISDNKVVSQSIVRVVYIPQEAGEQVLPEVKVAWFDVVNDKMQYAVVPETKITVTGGIAPKQVTMPTASNDIGEVREILPARQIKENFDDKTEKKQYILLIVIAFLAGVLLSFILMRKNSKSEKDIKTSEYVALVMKDLQQEDYRHLRDHILVWGSKTFSDQSINNLNNVAECIHNPEFSEQMEKLNGILYAGKVVPLDKEIIINTLKKEYKEKGRDKGDKPLPDLYK